MHLRPQKRMSRIRIDLSQVLTQDRHPRIWLHLNKNLSSAQDVLTYLKKKYHELEQLELCLSIEDFLIPPEMSVNIFKPDDVVKVSAVKKSQSINARINPEVATTTHGEKVLVAYPSTNTSIHSSINLSQTNVSTTGVGAEDEDSSSPNFKPLEWSEQFSKFLKNGHETESSLTSSEIMPRDQSSDQVCRVATKLMSSVPSLDTEDQKLNRSSSVKDSAREFSESPLQDLSISSITDYTLDSDRVMIRKKRTDYLPWYNSSISASSVKEAKRTQCEAIKKRHEELGLAWTVGNTYKQQHYETGHEDMMWIFSNTPVLGQIHDFMQKLRPRRISKVAMRGLREGHLVIATYPVDNKLYRAKIEKLFQVGSSGMDSVPTFRVRYIDYGNTSDVTGAHLYIWDEVLEIIPAQAVSCKLDTMKIFTNRPQVGSIEAKEFSEVLKQSNPISIQVRKVLRARDGVFSSIMVQKTPELVVDLFDSQGVNIVDRLASCEHLGRIIRDQSAMKSSCEGSSIAVQSRVASSSSRRYLPPTPEHLNSDERVDFDLEDAGVTETGFAKSLDRVERWLTSLQGLDMLPIDYHQEGEDLAKN